jgi:hypothetical protein
VIAALNDLDFSLRGYVMVSLNCLFTAGYLIYISKFQGVRSAARSQQRIRAVLAAHSDSAFASRPSAPKRRMLSHSLSVLTPRPRPGARRVQQLNDWGLMFYNNLVSLPFVVLICLARGDFSASAGYEHYSSVSFWVMHRRARVWRCDLPLRQACFVFQATLAFFLNYSIFLCTQLNTPLVTSVTGQIKNIATTAVGYFLFGDVQYSFWNVVGLIVGIAAR